MNKTYLKSVLILLTSIFLFSCAEKQIPDMVLINGGTFVMGSPSDEYDRDFDELQHYVTVSSFYLGVYQVTQKEYQNIIRKNPSDFTGDNLPVDNVSWYNALEYCNRLSKLNGLTPVYKLDGLNVMWDRSANGYRLPTEAEWEYACRAGTNTPFNTGDNITTSQANFDGNYPYGDVALGVFLEKTVPAGSYTSNLWGLFDMHGNLFDWCWDWYGDYTRDEQIDPVGPSHGNFRVIRGGSWVNSAFGIRSAYRGVYGPVNGSDRIGFRLARNASQ